MKIKSLIVDDEPLAREVLEGYLRQIEMVELVASCKSAMEAFHWMQKEDIDLIFLDINMPKISGIDFLRNMSPAATIIFTTAHREYAVESYELAVLDYLVKPIAFPRLLMAVNRYLQWQTKQTIPVVAETPFPTKSTDDAYLFLKADRKMVKVFYKDILYIESLKDYSRVHTSDQRIVTAKNLLYFENRLPQDRFFRIHKSYLLSIPKVSAYSHSEVEVAGITLPIGRTYKQGFFKIMTAD